MEMPVVDLPQPLAVQILARLQTTQNAEKPNYCCQAYLLIRMTLDINTSEVLRKRKILLD